jgi:ABC-type multidrug transport system fused ATPase/permease subunit
MEEQIIRELFNPESDFGKNYIEEIVRIYGLSAFIFGMIGLAVFRLSNIYKPYLRRMAVDRYKEENKKVVIRYISYILFTVMAFCLYKAYYARTFPYQTLVSKAKEILSP